MYFEIGKIQEIGNVLLIYVMYVCDRGLLKMF